MKRRAWVFMAALALALALCLPTAAVPGKSQGKGKPKSTGKSSEKAEPGKAKRKSQQEKETEEEKEHEHLAAQGRAFGKEQEKVIREWFGNQSHLQGLPPGLAKREELPAGLQRHLERNGTLPPGLQKRLEPLPKNLESKLPKTPEGVRRVVVGGAVILLEERTAKILDIVKDVFGRSGSKQSSTGRRLRRDK